jgi:hypothetical protein
LNITKVFWEWLPSWVPLLAEITSNQLIGCLQVLAWLEEGKDVRLGDWTAREIEFLNGWLLLTAKPAVYLVNCSKKDYIRKKNKFLPKIFEWVQANGGAPIIPFSGVFENEVGCAHATFPAVVQRCMKMIRVPSLGSATYVKCVCSIFHQRLPQSGVIGEPWPIACCHVPEHCRSHATAWPSHNKSALLHSFHPLHLHHLCAHHLQYAELAEGEREAAQPTAPCPNK